MQRAFLFGVFFLYLFQARGEAAFASSYDQWIDPTNHFVDYFTVNDQDQARVIFIGSSAYSRDGQGERPTVSEGMGYGLLLAYANDDQKSFDKFLRYVLGAANNYGCSAYGNNTCYASAPFMMPWIVNESGKPFWFESSPGGQSFYSNGSATDADIQIAWAVYLASVRVKNGHWTASSFQTVKGDWNYEEIFNEMALEIRLSDVDLSSLRYLPGNQWGDAGKQVLYPGYLTPQAFTALDTAPQPNISSKCPPLSTHTPPNSLSLLFKNNIAKTVSIDFLGGNGSVKVDGNFIPKPGVPNGYTVPAVTTAAALFSSDNEYYANATFRATFYNADGIAVMKSHYYIEYNKSKWTVTDQGSTQESAYCSSPTINEVFISLTDPNIGQVEYPFSSVMTNSLKAIEAFQTNYQTGLMPNVIHYDGTGYDQWSESFAYDACRFPLWTAQSLEHPEISGSLQKLLDSVKNFVRQGTLPSEGIDAIKQVAVGSWDVTSVALNAPILPAAIALKDQPLFDALSQGVFAYDITKNQPSSSDPQGDSSPYFNAVMVLLTRAILEQKL